MARALLQVWLLAPLSQVLAGLGLFGLQNSVLLFLFVSAPSSSQRECGCHSKAASQDEGSESTAMLCPQCFSAEAPGACCLLGLFAPILVPTKGALASAFSIPQILFSGDSDDSGSPKLHILMLKQLYDLFLS